jgi:predicted anti-sigma-YlaC factor YlaD
MNHQPFEMWLLDGATLDKAQHDQLQEHLKACKTCRRLACNLPRVEQKLAATPLAAPRPGFAARFQASLPARQLARQRRQIWSMIFSGLSVGVAIAIYQVLPDLARLSPGLIVSSLVNNILTAISSLLHLGQVSNYVLMRVPPSVPLAVWVSLTIVFLILSIVWVLALGRILAPKGDKA